MGAWCPYASRSGVIERWPIVSADLLCNPIHFPEGNSPEVTPRICLGCASASMQASCRLNSHTLHAIPSPPLTDHRQKLSLSSSNSNHRPHWTTDPCISDESLIPKSCFD